MILPAKGNAGGTNCHTAHNFTVYKPLVSTTINRIPQLTITTFKTAENTSIFCLAFVDVYIVSQNMKLNKKLLTFALCLN